ncbi:MAG: hypothetical protein DRJ36_04485, partial [Thermoprotei archaeon]
IPKDVVDVVSLGDKRIYLWVKFIDVYTQLNIKFILLNPRDATFLWEEIKLPSPRASLGINKYNWVFVHLKLPISADERGLMDLRTFPYYKLSYTFNVRPPHETGPWTFIVSVNGSTVARYAFLIRLVKVTIRTTDILARPLGNTTITIENHGKIVEKTETGHRTLLLRPGIYVLKVTWRNFTVFSGNLRVERDCEHIVTCSVSFLSLKVVDNSSKPLAGALVSLIAEGYPYKASLKTDSQGLLFLDFIPHTNYLVRVFWRGREVFADTISSGSNHTIKTPVYTVVLKVIGEQQQPIPGARILIHGANIVVYTNEKGEAKIEQLPAGEWFVNVRYKNSETNVILKVPEEDVIKLNVFIEIFGVAISKESFISLTIGIMSTLILLLLLILAHAYSRGRE